MRTQEEVQARIEDMVINNKHLLARPPADIAVNAFVALEQCRLRGELTQLYWIIGQPLPEFKMNAIGGLLAD
jgi:hypothetical protein